MKKCSKCKTLKELSEFNKAKTHKDGLSYLCTECNRQQSREYRLRNAEKYYLNQKLARETEGVFLSQALYALKVRAKKKGLDVDVDLEYLKKLLVDSKYLCSVTGQKMSLESHPRKKANPFKCSLDRIDSSKGYVKGNVRWVCWAVNQMKADRSDVEFKFWVETLYKAISSQA